MRHPAPARLVTLLVLLMALVQPEAGLAAEHAVRIDGGTEPIEGKLTEPAGPIGGAVLLLHGFNGHMDEVGHLFADLAGALAERGIASLRINFNGEGPQAGFRVTSTLESRIRESQLAFEFLRETLPVERYGAVGFSLGGLTTMAVIGEHPDWFESVVLWSAADRLALERDAEFAEARNVRLVDQLQMHDLVTVVVRAMLEPCVFIGVERREQGRRIGGPKLQRRARIGAAEHVRGVERDLAAALGDPAITAAGPERPRQSASPPCPPSCQLSIRL